MYQDWHSCRPSQVQERRQTAWRRVELSESDQLIHIELSTRTDILPLQADHAIRILAMQHQPFRPLGHRKRAHAIRNDDARVIRRDVTLRRALVCSQRDPCGCTHTHTLTRVEVKRERWRALAVIATKRLGLNQKSQTQMDNRTNRGPQQPIVHQIVSILTSSAKQFSTTTRSFTRTQYHENTIRDRWKCSGARHSCE